MMIHPVMRFLIVAMISYVAGLMFGTKAVLLCVAAAALYYFSVGTVRFVREMAHEIDWRAVKFYHAFGIIGGVAWLLLIAIAIPGMLGFPWLSNETTLLIAYWCMPIGLVGSTTFGIANAMKEEAARKA